MGSYVVYKGLWGTRKVLNGELQGLGGCVQQRGRPDDLSLQLTIKQEVSVELGGTSPPPLP